MKVAFSDCKCSTDFLRGKDILQSNWYFQWRMLKILRFENFWYINISSERFMFGRKNRWAIFFIINCRKFWKQLKKSSYNSWKIILFFQKNWWKQFKPYRKRKKDSNELQLMKRKKEIPTMVVITSATLFGHDKWNHAKSDYDLLEYGT